VAVVDHRHDVGVLHAAQALGLAVEAGAGLGVADQIGRQHLDHDRGVAEALPREVHETDAAAGDQPDDRIAPDRRARLGSIADDRSR
jgi:hypothetical protein